MQTELQRAQELKNEGNRLFKQGMFEDAIKKYSEAIECCPDKHNTEKSTYYQNKAAALEKLVCEINFTNHCFDVVTAFLWFVFIFY